jgi:hypothetical protein
MKKNLILCFLAFILFYSLESCESKSNRSQSGSHSSATKDPFVDIDKAIKAGEQDMRLRGYPQLSPAMQQLRYRCQTLGETDACQEFNQYMQQSINGMNQDIQRTGAQDNSR